MPLDHIAHLRTDGARFAGAVDTGPLEAPVAACGDWDLRQLTHHVGHIHRWARIAATTARRPDRDEIDDPPADSELADWIRSGVSDLADALEAIDPDAPTWHPFPVDKVGRVWPRRQCHELSIHRWDAQNAIGSADPIDAELASDGIDEYFEVMLPRLVTRESLELPSDSIHVHCTDVDGEWLVRAIDGEVSMTREHAKGDAALRGPAQHLLLMLWGRPVPDGAVDAIGDTAAADAWLALGGRVDRRPAELGRAEHPDPCGFRPDRRTLLRNGRCTSEVCR